MRVLDQVVFDAGTPLLLGEVGGRFQVALRVAAGLARAHARVGAREATWAAARAGGALAFGR
ncbi:MAG: hypothetical protein ACJ77Z_18880 [Thermoleophilaceae bacterium]